MAEHDSYKEFGDHLDVARKLYAMRRLPVPAHKNPTARDQVARLMEQFQDLCNIQYAVLCALNEAHKILDPSKSVKRKRTQ